MGKTQSKPLAARHIWGTAWARHAMSELALTGRSLICCLCMCVLYRLERRWRLESNSISAGRGSARLLSLVHAAVEVPCRLIFNTDCFLNTNYISLY